MKCNLLGECHMIGGIKLEYIVMFRDANSSTWGVAPAVFMARLPAFPPAGRALIPLLPSRFQLFNPGNNPSVHAIFLAGLALLPAPT